jgi:hypothetical protein
MSQVVPLKVHGQEIFVEVEQRYGSEETTSLGEVISQTRNAFEQARDTVTTIAANMIGAVREMDKALAPDEFNLEFAIKFTAEGNAVLAKAGAETNLQVTMVYKRPQS